MNKNNWLNFLEEYISPNKYKIWDIDTDVSRILMRFIQNCKSKNIFKPKKLIVKKTYTKHTGTNYYHLIIDSKIITPGDYRVNDGASWGAIRQYLQVLDLANIIFYDNQKIENIKEFEIINDSFLSKNEKQVLFNIGKRILSIGYSSPIDFYRNFWISLVLSLISEVDPFLILNISKLGYSKIKNRRNKSFSETIEEIKYTYKNFYNNDLLDYFKKYWETELLNGFESNLILEINRDYFTKYIFEKIKKKRSFISSQIRLIRNYINDSDLRGIKTEINTLDAAHIKPVKIIKQEALIEASKKNPSKEKIDQILNQIDNLNNIILIPHNYHYLLDKGYLILTLEGEFIKISKNLNVFKTFGIEDKVFIKNKIWTKERASFLRGNECQ